MEEGCDAMNVIDKLNQEFDVIMEKNIQLEKEKLELYKEIHKLKFKIMIEDDELIGSWGGDILWNWGCACLDGNPSGGWLGGMGWSDKLWDAYEDGLEKNVILCEIYDEDEWNNTEVGFPVLD